MQKYVLFYDAITLVGTSTMRCSSTTLEEIDRPSIELDASLQIDEPHAWLVDPAAGTATLVGRAIETGEVTLERDRRINAGFVFQGNTYDCDDASRQAIAMAASTAQGFGWIDAQNVTHALTVADMQSMNAAVVLHMQAHTLAARTLKDVVPIPQNYRDDSHWPTSND